MWWELHLVWSVLLWLDRKAVLATLYYSEWTLCQTVRWMGYNSKNTDHCWSSNGLSPAQGIHLLCPPPVSFTLYVPASYTHSTQYFLSIVPCLPLLLTLFSVPQSILDLFSLPWSKWLNPVCQNRMTDYGIGHRWLFIISISLIFSQLKSTPASCFLPFPPFFYFLFSCPFSFETAHFLLPFSPTLSGEWLMQHVSCPIKSHRSPTDCQMSHLNH